MIINGTVENRWMQYLSQKQQKEEFIPKVTLKDQILFTRVDFVYFKGIMRQAKTDCMYTSNISSRI